MLPSPDVTVMPSWLGWVGVVVGAGLILGSAEFLGPNEEHGWRLAGAAIPILYVVWWIGCSRWGSRSWRREVG